MAIERTDGRRIAECLPLSAQLLKCFLNIDSEHRPSRDRTVAPGRVSYSPDDPAVSTVETGIVDETCWIPRAGAAFPVFGLEVFFSGILALTR